VKTTTLVKHYMELLLLSFLFGKSYKVVLFFRYFDRGLYNFLKRYVILVFLSCNCIHVLDSGTLSSYLPQ